MARLIGPDAGSRYSYLASGAPAASLPAVVYSDAAGTVLADIRVYDGTQTPGAVILGSQVTTDVHGLLPMVWFPDGLDRLWVSVNGGPLAPVDADYNARLDMAAPPWVNVQAVRDGVTDDRAAIQAALDGAGRGATVYLPAGRYAVSAPIVVPPHVTLRGVHGNRTDTAQQYAVLSPLSTFVGAAVIRFLDMELGGYSGEHFGGRLTLITVDGSAAPAGVHGVQAVGRVRGVGLDRVALQNLPGRGVDTQPYTRADTNTYRPYSWSLRDCAAVETGSDGFYFHSTTDMQLVSCESLGAGGSGFVLTACANTRMIGCQSEWSSEQGYYVTGSWLTGQGSGGLTMVGCTSDRNSQNGVLVDATGAGQISLTGCQLRRDGRNGFPGTGGGSYAGLKVTAATMPVVADGLTVYPGVGDDGLGVNSPQYGVSASGSTAVIVSAGYLHAATQAWQDGGTNILLHRGPGVVGATGATGSPTRETATHLDVSGRALGMVTPRDHGLVAWTFDPVVVNSGKAGVAGTLYLAAVYVARAASVTAIRWGINTAGVTPTAGQNFVGVYSSAGTLLASAGVDADVTATGLRSTTITAQSLTPGLYWVALLFNAATPPAVYRSPSDLNATLLNAHIAGAAQMRFATNGTARTSMPASITPGSNTATQHSYWAALG